MPSNLLYVLLIVIGNTTVHDFKYLQHGRRSHIARRGTCPSSYECGGARVGTEVPIMTDGQHIGVGVGRMLYSLLGLFLSASAELPRPATTRTAAYYVGKSSPPSLAV